LSFGKPVFVGGGFVELSEVMKLSQEAIAGQPNGSGGSPA